MAAKRFAVFTVEPGNLFQKASGVRGVGDDGNQHLLPGFQFVCGSGQYERISRTVQRRHGKALSGTGKKFLEIERHQYKKDDIDKKPTRPVPDYNMKTEYDIINDRGLSRRFCLPALMNVS